MYPKCLRYLLVFCNILSEYGLYRHVNKLYTPKPDGQISDRNRYETCATLIFSKVLKSQKLKKREFGGHLGNDVIEKKLS